MSVNSSGLDGKVAIVTGGGSGIGRSIALEFARAGADVVVASRTLANLETVAGEVRALGKRSLAVPTDITLKADVDNLVQRVMDEFGVIDILVNNSGVIIKSPLLELREDDWDTVINTNLKGYFLCSQAVAKIMAVRKSGNIVNIASAAVMRPGENNAAYAISKAGVVMLTRTLSRELGGYNVRVNAIAPSVVRTEMSRDWWDNPEDMESIKAVVPLGRIAEVSDVTGTALFLASDASGYINGHTILMDGGRSA